MKRPTTFCVKHDREWTGEPHEECPWCEIERLQAIIAAIPDRLASYECDEPHWGGQSEYYPPVAWRDWLSLPHDGDCVKQPQMCRRCFAEHIRHKSDWILAAEAAGGEA